MRAVLVSRYPRVDTKAWKQRVAADLLEAGFDVSVLYSQSALADQALAGIREEGPGVLRRYAALRGRGRGSAARGSAETRSLADWAAERGVRVEGRRRLADAVDVLGRLAPDLLVLVGADVVPASVLAIPRLGTINAHYALLPEFRGMNVAEWSVFCGAPAGVTVHLVNAGIDTGPILLREEIPLAPGETFATLRAKQQALAARLLVRAARDLRDGTASPLPQDAAAGRQYYRMHPALRRAAEARLRSRAG